VRKLVGGRFVVGLEPAFELIELPRKCSVGGEEFAQPNERPDHIDAHLQGARAIQDGCGHDDAVLGEGVRQVLSVLSATTL